MSGIHYIKNTQFSPQAPQQENDKISTQVLQFHQKIPGFSPSPLTQLPALTKKLALKSIHIKDESARFNLNSFKALGGAYAIGNLIAQRYDVLLAELDLNRLSHLITEPMTFATATAGNHGIGIAWVAQALGQRAVIFMPKNTPSGQVNTVKALGAETIVTDFAYDETVEHAKRIAQENDWHIVQDTAWEGYEQIPQWIMQGYHTLAHEMMAQFEEQEQTLPSHIFLQAGVGSMAGGVLDYLAQHFDLSQITTIITEPVNADCLFQSAANHHRTELSHPVSSIMNGLACAVPNPIAWPIINNHCQHFVSVDDAFAEHGMQILQSPIGGDATIHSGPSGAVNVGLLHELMTDAQAADIKNALQLSSDSRVLLINTENNPNTFSLTTTDKIQHTTAID